MSGERWVAATVAVALCLVLVALVRKALVRQESPVGTGTTFLAVWSFSLGLFAVPWIRYSRSSVLSWLLIYGSIVCFLLGAFAANRLGRSSGSTGSWESLSVRHVHLAWLTTGLLSLIGFGFFVHATDVTVGWRTLIDNPSVARLAQSVPQFDSAYGVGKFFSYCGGFSLLLWTVALRERMFTGRSRIAVPLVVLVLVPYLLMGERLSLVTVAIWVVGFHVVWRNGPSRRNLLRGGVVLLVAAAAFFFVIAGRKHSTISNNPGIRAALSTGSFDQLALPYLYVTGNFAEFSRLVQDPIAPRTYGQLTVQPLTKLAYRVLRVSQQPPKGGAFYPIPFDGYNATTWLDPFYRDFGVAGCLLLPIAIGFGTTWILLLARRRRTFALTWLAGGALSVVAFSPLKNQIQDAATWEWVILAPMVATFVRGESVVKKARGFAVGLRERLSPWALAAGATTAAALLALVVVRVGSTPAAAAQNSRSVLAARMTIAAERALRVFREHVQPTSQSLATQLGVSDPSDFYQAIWIATEMPLRPGWIGVYVGKHQFHLIAFTTSRESVELTGVESGGSYRISGPSTM